MLIVEVKKGESIDVAIKRLKIKFKKTKVVEQLRDRQAFKKPSEKKREMKMAAVHKQKLRDQEENG
jgi:small subunit ribosomal protein S21